MTRFALLVLTAVAMFGQANHDLGYDDTPMLPGLPFHVHDAKRPHPPVVTPAAQAGGAPSDAIVLFDGKDLSEWQSGKSNWKVANGYLEVAPGAGDLATRQKFGDVQLHVEWAAPIEIRGNSQNRGNSGIYLQGRYEVQVLDSYQNPTYADGQAGALYGQWPPLATVFLNGVLLHNHKALMGPTVHRALAKYVAQPAEDSLVLQDHQQPVRYRNIWIRRLSTYDQPEK
jgi:hypothetical protein